VWVKDKRTEAPLSGERGKRNVSPGVFIFYELDCASRDDMSRYAGDLQMTKCDAYQAHDRGTPNSSREINWLAQLSRSRIYWTHTRGRKIRK